MRKKLALILLIFFPWFNSASAFSQPINAINAYNSGDWGKAALLAGQINTEQSQCFAAEAILTEASFKGPSKTSKRKLSQINDYINKAYNLNSKSVCASTLIATNSLIKARIAGPIKSLRLGLVKSSKNQIIEAITLDTNNARAYALLGTWNFEVVRIAGKQNAMIFGADIEAGRKNFQKALVISPNDVSIRMLFANSILMSKEVDHIKESRTQLEIINKFNAQTARDNQIKYRASLLLAKLRQNQTSEAIKLASLWF